MKCEVCGMLVQGFAHVCSGVAPPLSPEEAEPPPDGLALGYYLRMAFQIARWDDMAVRRAARDADSLFYGAVFSAIAAAAIFLVTALPGILRHDEATPGTAVWGIVLGLVFVWIAYTVIAILQLGLCHFILKWFLGATGTFVGVLRPLLMGWFVNGLAMIPIIGPLTAAIAWTAVLMLVFEEVDGVGRMRAFLVSAGINAITLAVTYFFR